MASKQFLEQLGAVTTSIHGMPCTNYCQHCWVQGSVRKPRMPFDQIVFILEKLALLKEHVPAVGFFLYDEPTNHPQFVEIIERAAELGLLHEDFFIPTNGSILARSSDDTWKRLKDAGMNWLQFTLYGLEQTHDQFAGRRGAFQNVITAANRATEHGIGWYVGVIFHAGNANELADTIEYARNLDPSGNARVGWYSFFWQGRGRSARRPRAADFDSLPETVRKNDRWIEEREAVRRILESHDMSARSAGEPICDSLVLEVDHDMQVFCGGACDSGGIAGAVPELRQEFALGYLGRDGLLPLLEAYQRRPPRVLQVLTDVTWGELAERYGDRENDEIYYLTDLPLHKWAAAHLLEILN